jgi:hypothetical protein
VEGLVQRVHVWSDALGPNLTGAEARTIRREADDLSERIRQRILFVRRELGGPTFKPEP